MAGDAVTISDTAANIAALSAVQITALQGNGIDTILGDNGVVERDASGLHYTHIATFTQPQITDLGGDDQITALDGDKILINDPYYADRKTLDADLARLMVAMLAAQLEVK